MNHSRQPFETDHVRAMADRLPQTPGTVPRVAVAAAVAQDSPWAAARTAEQANTWHAHLAGLGPLQPLLGPTVTDIVVNGPSSVWVDDGKGLSRTGVRFASEDAVRALAVRLAAQCGQRLDDAMPWVDGQLPGRIRLHAVLPPLAVDGTAISLRIPAPHAWSLADLHAHRALPAAWVPVLTALVHSKAAFLVSGGTGSGKTTLLSALLGAADPADRVVVVEDARELTIPAPHVVALQARRVNVENCGRVTVADMVRQALRMRPDRLVIGECRGPEMTDLLLAVNTGHAGGCATVHANSAVDVPARVAALTSLAGWSEQTTGTHFRGAFQVLIHTERHGNHRYVRQLAVLDPDRADGTAVTIAAEQDHRGQVHRRSGWAQLLGVCGLSAEASK